MLPGVCCAIFELLSLDHPIRNSSRPVMLAAVCLQAQRCSALRQLRISLQRRAHAVSTAPLATSQVNTGTPGPEEQALARQNVSFVKQFIHGWRFSWRSSWQDRESSEDFKTGQLALELPGEAGAVLPLVDRAHCLGGIIRDLHAASGLDTLPQTKYR
jgi:hypothetical protein